MTKEKNTVAASIRIYCRGMHKTKKGLCVECGSLLEYVHLRLDKCPFGENKPVCAKCPIHCYKADIRQKIIVVMRYSSRRMLYRHPILALRHIILLKTRSVPAKPFKTEVVK